MKIIISPAKKMMYEDTISHKQLPVFLDRTELLMKYLKSLSYDELKKLLVCNDEIAALNYKRYANMDLRKNLTPAILFYDGIQYKYMAPQVFDDSYFDYIEKHLCILSGFYGLTFGALCAVIYFFIGGPSAAFSYWISGIAYDIPHCIGNVVLCLMLYKPLRFILEKAVYESGR